LPRLIAVSGWNQKFKERLINGFGFAEMAV